MGRLKKMIAVLLPVFWLVAFVSSPFESLACAWPAECASSSAGDAATQSGDPCCSSNDQIRCEMRRNGLVRIQTEQPRLGLFSNDQALPSHSFASAIPLTGEAFLLQQRWQFVWRTADSPRAPSSLA
jgi:hypothetical protein